MLESVSHLSAAILDTFAVKQDESYQPLTVSVAEISDSEDEQVNSDLDLAALNIDLSATHIQSSPYSDPVNHLNLQELTTPFRLFALALTQLDSIRSDYATASYLDSFNWPSLFDLLKKLCSHTNFHWQRQEFYLVIFRSKLRPTADRARLGELDKNSHQEACASGGLLTYWFGSPDAERKNLATCIWRNREDAAAGGTGPWHRKARGAAREMYDEISFHTHRFVVEEGVERWWLEDYPHGTRG